MLCFVNIHSYLRIRLSIFNHVIHSRQAIKCLIKEVSFPAACAVQTHAHVWQEFWAALISSEGLYVDGVSNRDLRVLRPLSVSVFVGVSHWDHWLHLVDCLGNFIATKHSSQLSYCLSFATVLPVLAHFQFFWQLIPLLSPLVENIAHCEFAYLRDLLIRWGNFVSILVCLGLKFCLFSCSVCLKIPSRHVLTYKNALLCIIMCIWYVYSTRKDKWPS